MKGYSVLFVGCGDIGIRTGNRLQGAGWRVGGVRRDPSQLPQGFERHCGDYAQPGSLAFIAGLEPDYVVATFNPTDRSEGGYRRGFTEAMANLLAGLGSHRPQHIVAVSSTRVFAEREGGWVDEDSPLATDDARASAIIEAERILLSSSHPATLVRFAGIYGASGGRLLARIKAGELCNPEPVRYTNRIHRADCAGFLAHLLKSNADGQTLSRVYIGVDSEPAAQFEVESWLATELGIEARAGFEPPLHGPAGHKRCDNARLMQSGYRLVYPNYRAGYRAVIQAR